MRQHANNSRWRDRIELDTFVVLIELFRHLRANRVRLDVYNQTVELILKLVRLEAHQVDPSQVDQVDSKTNSIFTFTQFDCNLICRKNRLM